MIIWGKARTLRGINREIEIWFLELGFKTTLKVIGLSGSFVIYNVTYI